MSAIPCGRGWINCATTEWLDQWRWRGPPSDIYKIAVEEYRFQAQFNWSRTQYLLAFNAGILVAATAVASRPGHGAALVFLLGAVASGLSILAVRRQHDYYRAARDHLRRVEDVLRLADDQRLDTTSTMEGRPRRVSVNQVVYLILVSVVLFDFIGAAAIAFR